MERLRRYSDTVHVKTTKAAGGQVALTEAGVAMAGAGGAETKQVT